MSKILVNSREENLNSKWSFGSSSKKLSQLKSLPPIKSIYSTTPLKIIKNIDTKIYLPLDERKAKVKSLEEKLMVDWTRQFDGLGDAQKDVLIKLIDKNAKLRKQVKLEPGIGEKLEDPLFDITSDSDNSNAAELSHAGVSIRIGDGNESQELITKASSEVDLFYLDYPLQDYKRIGSRPPGHDSDDQKKMCKKQTKEEMSKHLRHLYGKFIENKLSQQSSSDLELEAMESMKMVSADLQSWVTDVLENSIPMDPAIIQLVNEMDEKAGVIPSNPIIPEIDITGFNVLLNACKPAILEARPPMKLNVVQEVGRSGSLSIPQHPDTQSRKNHNSKTVSKFRHGQYGAWYLPISQWNIKKGTKEAEHLAKSKHVFGGIVQQKLDDINKKRETDMKTLLKENGEGSKKRNK